jgi:hypothetical protein
MPRREDFVTDIAQNDAAKRDLQNIPREEGESVAVIARK